MAPLKGAGAETSTLVAQVLAVRPGDHLLCRATAAFGGVHAKLLKHYQINSDLCMIYLGHARFDP
jgi:hypothetical protein